VLASDISVFTGYFFSKSTNLYFAKARWYDPETARFTTQDSYLGQPDDPPSLHRYFYGNANPTRYIDLTGHAGRENRRLRPGDHVVVDDGQGNVFVTELGLAVGEVEVTATAADTADSLALYTSATMEDPLNRVSGAARVTTGGFQIAIAVGMVETPLAPLAPVVAYRGGENIGTGGRMMVTGEAAESPSARLARNITVAATGNPQAGENAAIATELVFDFTVGMAVNTPLKSGVNAQSPLGAC
jgi:RHS repeat-associated protein